MKSSPAAIDLQKVSAFYKSGELVLDEISFEVPAGQHLSIVGPSGSGKTTLLRIIAGQHAPHSGRVEKRGKVAFIHQDLRLVAQHSALLNVLLGALSRVSLPRSLAGFPRAECELAKALLARVGLGQKLYQPVYKMSGGEKQRVAIARALMQNPDIILADEPVSALDEVNAHSVLKLLSEISKERRVTLVSVLHQRPLAVLFADRVITLASSEITHDAKSAPAHKNVPKSEVPAQDETPLSAPWSIPVSPLRNHPTTVITFLLFAAALASILFLDFEGARIDDALWQLTIFTRGLFPNSWDELNSIPWVLLGGALLETIQMALIATTFGMILSLPISALAARTISPRLIVSPLRFILNGLRTVPSLIWALLFVAAVGLGPLAGISALTVYSVGYLTKFFYEAFESVEQGPVSALREIGGSRLQCFFYAIWPAAKPAILTSSLFMVEYNVRAASILGVVDAGGIGFYIKEYIDYRFFPAVTASLVLILLVVMVLDALSGVVRKRLVIG